MIYDVISFAVVVGIA